MDSKRTVGVSKITLNMEGLENIMRESSKSLSVRVGILGAKTNRETTVRPSYGQRAKAVAKSANEMSNADIGLVHEKGSKTKNIPRRSFLQMPLELKFKDAFKEQTQFFFNALAKGTIKQFLKKVGILGENVVQGAFATDGFGRWAKLKQSTINRKGSSAILIDSAQLRASITSDVVVR